MNALAALVSVTLLRGLHASTYREVGHRRCRACDLRAACVRVHPWCHSCLDRAFDTGAGERPVKGQSGEGRKVRALPWNPPEGAALWNSRQGQRPWKPSIVWGEGGGSGAGLGRPSHPAIAAV